MHTLDVHALLERVCDDPWSLARDERRALLDSRGVAQRTWSERIARALAQAPSGAARQLPEDLPAFLLGEAPYRHLGDALDDTVPSDALVVDQLEHFVELFRNWAEGGSPACPAGRSAGEPLRDGELAD